MYLVRVQKMSGYLELVLKITTYLELVWKNSDIPRTRAGKSVGPRDHGRRTAWSPQNSLSRVGALVRGWHSLKIFRRTLHPLEPLPPKNYANFLVKNIEIWIFGINKQIFLKTVPSAR